MFERIFLGKEIHIFLGSLRGVSLKDIVGKENVGDSVLMHEVFHIPSKVTVVYHIDVAEGVEEIARYGITEAVLKHQQTPGALSGGMYMSNLCVCPHKSAVGTTTAVTELDKVDAQVRLPLANDTVVFVYLIVSICCRIAHSLRDIVHEILRRILQ